MNDKQLRSLIAVAETGSLTQAAGRLYLSVPSIKKQIDTLEDELGVTLFSRTNRGLTLTEEGQEFFSFSQRAIESLDRELAQIRAIRDNRRQTIRIGYDNIHVREDIFLYAISAYREQNPAVVIHNEHVSSFDGENCDLFYGANVMDNPDIRVHYLCDLPLTCLIPRSNPLSRYETLALPQLCGYELLLPPREMLSRVEPNLFDVLEKQHEGVLQYIPLEEPDNPTIKMGLLYDKISVIIGFEENVYEHLLQIPVEGFHFPYYIFSSRCEEKPELERFIAFLQDFYPKQLMRQGKLARCVP